MALKLDEESRLDMDRAVRGLTTKSDKIRTLSAAGYERADIARYLDIRYQHVRNVLVRDERATASSADRCLPDANMDMASQAVWGQVGPDGRVVIPAAFRQELGLENGGPILMTLEEGELRMVGREAAVARAQALVAKFAPRDASLVDALLAERQVEVERENSDG